MASMKDGPEATKVATIEGRRTAGEGSAAGSDGAGARPGERGRREAPADRYRVLSRLGKGGMGDVMLVRDDEIGREVALKRMRKANPSDRLVRRFLREASVQGRLEHPAIVPLYDLGRDGAGQPFFTMKRLTGTTLAHIFERAREGHTLQRLLRAFTDVCLAVELAHTRGIIHRDLKPENIVLGDFGEVYVLDWGVAKVVGESDSEFADISSGSADDSADATQPGAIVGTAGYMPPEQIASSADVDARADVYALGCILFEILAGDRLHPPGAAGLATARAGYLERPSARARGREVPPELDALCLQALAPARDDRPPTARALGERVQLYLDGDRDLALRGKLARAHLAAAQAAFAAGDDEVSRTRAMREAASALALDPKLTAAAALVGRLMLEPPTTIPREVEEAIVIDDTNASRASSRLGIGAYLAFIGFIPLLWWIAPAGSPYVPALAVIAVVGLGVCHAGSRPGAAAHAHLLEPGLAICNAVLLAVLARMFTPLMIAPALAAMSTMAIVFTPLRSRLTTAPAMAGLAALAVLGPWLLESVGALPVTIVVDPQGVLLRAPGIAGAETPTLVVAALYVAALILAAALMAHGMRARERAARRHLHVQAWQLRQLVPR